MRHAEVAAQVLLHVAALLVADHHDRLAIQPSPPAHDRLVVPIAAVPVQLDPVGEAALHVVEGIWPAGMAGYLNPLDGPEIPVGLLPERLQLLAEHVQLLRHVDPLPVDQVEQAADPCLNLRDVPLELQLTRGDQG